MHRIDGEGHDGNMFTGGDPLIPTPATVITTDWLNAIQEEVVAPILAAGIALVKGTNNQLLAALYALFGRLGVNNTWSGNQSFGGSISVTASTTLTGPLTANGTATFNSTVNMVGPLTITSGSQALAIKTTTDDAYIAFYPRTATPNTRGGYFGVPAPGGTEIAVVNEMASGNIRFTPGTGGRVTAAAGTAATASTPQTALALTNGYLSLDGVTAPNSNVAVKNALTPKNICKVTASVQATGTGSVILNDGFNAASVALSGGRVVLTFAQSFASAAYQVAIGAEAFPGPIQVLYRNKAAGSIEFEIYNGVGTLLNAASNPATFDVTITGRQ